MIKFKLTIFWIILIISLLILFTILINVYKNYFYLELGAFILAIIILLSVPICIIDNKLNKKYIKKDKLSQEIEHLKYKEDVEIKRAEQVLEREEIQLDKLKDILIISEKGKLEKIKKIVKVSNRVNIEMMRNALDLDKKSFDIQLIEWADRFDFIIDGDYLIINQDTISSFINMLDKQYEEWEKLEKDKKSKI